MAKLNWNPWMGEDDVADALDRLARHAPGGARWNPAADVLETPEAYVVRVELPGLERSDVSLEVAAGALKITGTRPFQKSAGGVYHVLERSFGPFSRTFALPDDFDPDRIKAVLSQGLLTVTLPRTGPTRRRIQVRGED
jgi:HSP20 family protein